MSQKPKVTQGFAKYVTYDPDSDHEYLGHADQKTAEKAANDFAQQTIDDIDPNVESYTTEVAIYQLVGVVQKTRRVTNTVKFIKS